MVTNSNCLLDFSEEQEVNILKNTIISNGAIKIMNKKMIPLRQRKKIYNLEKSHKIFEFS